MFDGDVDIGTSIFETLMSIRILEDAIREGIKEDNELGISVKDWFLRKVILLSKCGTLICKFCITKYVFSEV